MEDHDFESDDEDLLAFDEQDLEGTSLRSKYLKI
jgi:hypothetical protein